MTALGARVALHYAVKLHVDKNNYGASWIIGLGGYQTGALWVMNPDGATGSDDNDAPLFVPGPLRGNLHLKAGSHWSISGKAKGFGLLLSEQLP